MGLNCKSYGIKKQFTGGHFMSKERCRFFVGQYTVDFLTGDIGQLEKIVKTTLENKGIRTDSIECVTTGNGVFLNFNISGLDYEYRDRHGTATEPIKVITAYFRREAGFSTYELMKELEKQGKKDLEHADIRCYDVSFWTDSRYRFYRHKTWYKLVGYNHYIYNDDIYSQEFIDDIESYLINLIAMKKD